MRGFNCIEELNPFRVAFKGWERILEEDWRGFCLGDNFLNLAYVMGIFSKAVGRDWVWH
jgi:hypothetical protein